MCFLNTSRSDGIRIQKRMRSWKGSSEDRGPQGSAVLEVAGGSSCLLRSLCGAFIRAVRRHRCKKKHQPYKFIRGAWMRCLAKRGPRCRGRGEAAGDCVFTSEPFRTAAVDRRDGPVLTALYGIVPSPVFEAPARYVGKNRTRNLREDGGTIHVERSIDRIRERKPSGAYVKRGGAKGQAATFPGP